MKLLRTVRGPRAHAQLIGGEVSLLPAADHAATLRIMREHGREPMSMSHGDFDYDYLLALATSPAGGPRAARRLSFAGHFDMMMSGRRGIPRPPDEQSLDPYRRQFTYMFARLRREVGTRSFLAHNMTVTATNIDQIAGVVRSCHDAGFGMFSFQPAAFVGDARRWRQSQRDFTDDQVWKQIELGADTRLPFRALQHGDERCNRTTYGFYVGDRYHPVLDDLEPADLDARDAFLRYLGGVTFSASSPAVLVVKVVRVLARHPSVAWYFGAWLLRMVAKVGVLRLLKHGVRPVTFVMHSFMDAAAVAPAWDALQRGEDCADPTLAETQQRLRACSYVMAHPETGQLVPACVQHSVLDPSENDRLRRLLPLTPVSRKAV